RRRIPNGLRSRWAARAPEFQAPAAPRRRPAGWALYCRPRAPALTARRQPAANRNCDSPSTIFPYSCPHVAKTPRPRTDLNLLLPVAWLTRRHPPNGIPEIPATLVSG